MESFVATVYLSSVVFLSTRVFVNFVVSVKAILPRDSWYIRYSFCSFHEFEVKVTDCYAHLDSWTRNHGAT